MSKRTLCMNGMTVIALAASTAWAQPSGDKSSHDGVSVRASTHYDRGGFWRTLFGEEWRDVWSAEITVPVLDLGSYAGGLEPYKAGGNQSKTLRFHGADGRTYIFRSTEKHVKNTLPKDLKNIPLGGLAQDQAASLHPTGSLAVAVLQDAVGLLHATPTLVYMPDDPRLGKFREDFANTLGQIEERPDDEKDGVTFAGAEKISGGSKLLEKLEESTEDTLDRREYLTARLLDFLIGDTDRGSDQWQFAKFEQGKHDVYRPIPRDRDYAFMRVDGLVAGLADRVHPRLVCFNEHYPSMESLLYMTADFDRSHLIDLGWQDWEAVATSMQQRITNDVIDRAVGQLPEAHREKSGAKLVAGLRARRDALPEIAREFYLVVNREADIFASDEAERAEIDRDPDGTVRVRLWRAEGKDKPDATPASASASPSSSRDAAGRLVFDRRFTPDETDEIRVYLERGDDRAVVRGAADRSIPVRIIGGEGDDVLVDSSAVERTGSTTFYDAGGENTFVQGDHTHVVTRPFVTNPPANGEEDEDKPEENPRELSEERRGRYRDQLPEETDYIAEQFLPGERYWGSSSGWDPMTAYRESGGVVLGVGPATTHWGFRRRPYDWHAELHGMVGTRNGELGVRLRTDRHFENSPWSIALFAHASQLESNRFYGYGNDTELLDPSFTLIERFEVLVQPSLRYSFHEKSTLDFGPIVRYVDPDIPGASPAADAMPLGSEPFGQAGARADLILDWTDIKPERQSGFGFNTGVSAYPSAWDAEEAFGEAHALARVFIPVGWPTLALRAGGQHNWGEFPLHESAFIGGRWSVRGFRWNRFAGESSAYGSVELRVPVAEMTLLTHGQLGVIGFTDAGRVWMDGGSDGGWHSGYGGGLWFGSLSRQVSFTYAYGDEHRVYFYAGMPF